MHLRASTLLMVCSPSGIGINLGKVSGLNKPKQGIERGNFMDAFNILNFHHMIRGVKQALQCCHVMGNFLDDYAN